MRSALATPLLGGLTPAEFMRDHWQKKPLLVRGAVRDAIPELGRKRMFALAAQEGVESRLVVNHGGRWSVRHGPITRRALPALATPGWTLLVQGVDLHDDAAHRLLGRFRFIADARLDDLMLSFASDGGGVGPHVDSYDVFLLQVEGRRRWRIGRSAHPRLRDDVPLKMLADFRPRHDWLLGAGDMLYLPPGWGHDGIAEGLCITASIGFRAPDARQLGADVLRRMIDAAQEAEAVGGNGRPSRYADAGKPATLCPARIPASLQAFGDAAVERMAADVGSRRRALGEVLSEPKATTWFERCESPALGGGIVLDRRTRMLYDDAHVYVNGESHVAPRSLAAPLRRLADRRCLTAPEVASLAAPLRALLLQWLQAGWCSSAASADPSQTKKERAR